MTQRQKPGVDFLFPQGYFASFEDIPGPELYRVGWFDGPLPRAAVTPDCHWLWLLEEGAGSLELDGETVPLTCGRAVFVHRGRSCFLRPSGGQTLRCYALGFSLDGCENDPMLGSLCQFYEEQRLCEGEDIHGMRTAFSHLIGELYEQTHPTLLHRYLLQLLVCACRDFTAASPQQRLPGYTGRAIGYTTYAVVRYVDAHLCEPELLPGLAHALGYNYQYLSHLFRRKTGMTLQDYVTRRRIDYAKELLAQEDLTITDIARLLQYKSLPSFRQAFRRAVGCSPAEFRTQSQRKSAPRRGAPSPKRRL